MVAPRNARAGDSELSEPTRRGWVERGAFALLALIVGCYAAIGSLANAVAKVDPARGYALSPSNGSILARYAEDVFSREPNSDPRSLSARLAQRALMEDATAAGALTVLAFQAQLRRETTRADQLLRYSTALSRRELRPRLWSIEDAVNRGDIHGALRNYDIALRTSREAPRMLYPVLGAAMSEPRIRSEMLHILATRPIWFEEFIDYVARRGIEPKGLIALLAEGRSIGLQTTADVRAHLVNALIAQGEPEQAWAYYETFRPGVKRDQSRDPGFTQTANVRAVFDWRIGDDPRLSAAILTNGSSGVLDFQVPNSIGGVLVRQTQVLPPGRYQLEGSSRDLAQSAASQPYWTLSCDDGRELGQVNLSNSSDDRGHFSGRFVVPQGCPVQTLILMARPSDRISGVSGQIDHVQLVPSK